MSREELTQRLKKEMERTGQLKAYEQEIIRRSNIRQLQALKPLCKFFKRMAALQIEDLNMAEGSMERSHEWGYKELEPEDLSLLSQNIGLEVEKAVVVKHTLHPKISIGLGFQGCYNKDHDIINFMAQADGAIWLENVYPNLLVDIDYVEARSLERTAIGLRLMKSVAKEALRRRES